MDEDLAGWAAEQLGRITQMRLEAAEAVVGGDYEAAIRISEQAFELSRFTLDRLADVEEPEITPYEAVAFATLADLAVARAASGQLDEGPGVDLASLGTALLLLARTDTRQPTTDAARRSCPHGRFSYTGQCLKRPPCPQLT